MTIDADTLERLVPDLMDREDEAGQETLALHVERYEFAAKYAQPGRLLDMACGVGYGTRILADRATGIESALGVDIAPAAIDYAEGHYADARVRYTRCDATKFHDEAGFDTVVSLETVEHVPDPAVLFANLVSLVRPGGVLVSSVPTTPSVDLNHHHLHDFTAAGFRRMGASHDLVEVAELPQVQSLSPLELVRGRRFKKGNLRPNLLGYYLAHPGAFLNRIGATLRYGLSARYLTIVWRKPAAP